MDYRSKFYASQSLQAYSAIIDCNDIGNWRNRFCWTGSDPAASRYGPACAHLAPSFEGVAKFATQHTGGGGSMQP